MDMKKCLLCLFVFLLSSNVFSQNLDELFDDGGISESNLKVKTYPFSFFQGQFPIKAEYVFNSKFGIEGGIGLLTPYGIVDMEKYNFELMLDNTKFGMSYSLGANLYTYLRDNNGFSFGLGTQIKQFSDYTLTGYFGQTKYTYNPTGRLLLELHMGLKITHIEYTAPKYYYDDEYMPSFHIGIGVGYIL